MIWFSNIQISPKKYSKKTILSLKFKFPDNNSKVWFVFQISKFPPKNIPKKLSWAWNLDFKFRIVFWNVFFFFGDWEIWKTNHTYWKKPHLKLNRWNESFYYVLLFTCDEVASTKSVPCKEIEPEILIYNNVVLAFHDACLLLPLASYKLWLYCRVTSYLSALGFYEILTFTSLKYPAWFFS